MEEELDAPRLLAHAAGHDLADEDVPVGVNRVVAAQPQSEVVVVQQDVGDDRVAEVAERPLPAIVLHPAYSVISPHAETEGRSGMVSIPRGESRDRQSGTAHQSRRAASRYRH